MLKKPKIQKLKHKKLNTNSGITLIALVITIIIMLILVAVTITMAVNGGLFDYAGKAAVHTKITELEEKANLIYAELVIDKYIGALKNPAMIDVINKLKQEGYEFETIGAETITDILLDSSLISIQPNATAKIQVTYETTANENTEDSLYYAVINGKYYKMNNENDKITIDKEASEIDLPGEKTLKVEVTEGNTVTAEKINENEIAINGTNVTGTSVITVTYGNFSKTCTVVVRITPTETSVANSETTLFPTNYGTIEVLWLEGTTNKVSSKPNTPALASNGEALKPVVFNSATNTWDITDVTNSNWYNYAPASQERGQNGKLVDNTTSIWANAITENNSFFVWIPRYAYRIIYYENETNTTPTGYYDGWGMWKAEDGSVKYELDEGIETVDYNGNKYIVHPAFMKDTGKTAKNGTQLEDFARGGWDSNLTGFWVSKFEAGKTNELLESTYGTESIGYLNIGGQYQTARQATYGYVGRTDSDGNKSFMNSHMMKNSEWGAVAYLTHSKYGRNGNEISINNNGTAYYRGGGSGTAYIQNVNQSTTGNVYGVYDLSGNKWERTAVFNNTDINNHFSNFGWTTATGLTTSSNSTKYATKYYNPTTANSGNATVYNYGKIGDATKEMSLGGADLGTSSSLQNNWFTDFPYFLNAGNPFVARGRRLCRWGIRRNILFI